MDYFYHLKEERKRLGLSQAVLAAECGVSREMWGKYERGQASPNCEVMEKLAGLGINVLYILTGRREAEALSTEEKLLIERYRAADEATRYRILSSLLEGKTSTQASADSNQVTQTIGIAGQVAGRDIKSK